MTAPEQQVAEPGATGTLWRSVLLLGAVGAVAGALAVVLALVDGLAFAEAGVGARVWWFHHANPLGGLLILAAGLIGVAAGALRKVLVALLAAAGMLALAAVVPVGQALGVNVLGGSASTVGLCLALGGGLLACALTARIAER